ncbi:MAG: hypothetical protein OXR68_01395 [Alphaproteobacteria bacterium]|nr:hypothetical protein [Alphaproteobacteria bacterium]MDD9919266.1 hypothetical protein [Alphaproteobacteria bacterium]
MNMIQQLTQDSRSTVANLNFLGNTVYIEYYQADGTIFRDIVRFDDTGVEDAWDAEETVKDGAAVWEKKGPPFSQEYSAFHDSVKKGGLINYLDKTAQYTYEDGTPAHPDVEYAFITIEGRVVTVYFEEVEEKE